MKRISLLLFTLMMVAALSGCRNNSSSSGGSFSSSSSGGSSDSGDSNQLTSGKVETAVSSMLDEWRFGGSVNVRGIQEIPRENAAIADLQFSNFEYGVTFEGQLLRKSKFRIPPKSGNPIPPPDEMFPPRKVTYSKDGKAILSRYNDGRWVLKEVRWGFDTGVKGTVELR